MSDVALARSVEIERMHSLVCDRRFPVHPLDCFAR